MPLPNTFPYQNPFPYGSGGFPGGGGTQLPQLPPYNTGGGFPGGGGQQLPQLPYMGMPPVQPGNPEMPNTPPIQPPGAASNPWNPYGTGGGNWNSPFQYPTYGEQYQNWMPDFGEDGATGFYQNLISGDQEVSGGAWNDYVRALANNLLTSGMFAPSQAQTYYGVLNPEMQYGLDPNNDVLPYGGPTTDTQAQQWNSPDYWNDLSQQLSSYTGQLFGGMAGDQTAGSQDMVERANRWLRDVVDMGRRYSASDSNDYWSTARARDRNEGWDYLSNQAQAMGLGEEFVNLGSSIYNPNVGQGPQSTLFNTGAFRQRNQNYR